MVLQTVVARGFILLTATSSVLAFGRLVRRQETDLPGDPFVNIPGQCTETCQPLFDYMCEARECECTNNAAQLLATCLNCVVGAGGDQAVAQTAFDSFRDDCARDGLPVDPVQITPSPSGGASSTTGPTTTGTGTSVTTTGTSTSPLSTTTTGTGTTATTSTATGTGTGTTAGSGTGPTDAPNNNGTSRLSGTGMIIVTFAMLALGLVIGY